MRAHYIIIFFITSLSTSFTRGTHSKFQDSNKPRRILHQPLFPAISAQPSPPPPPLDTSDSSDQDQPFSHEFPTGPTLDQSQQPPAFPAMANPVMGPAQALQSRQTKKVAIAITSAILTLGMLTGLAFFLYKNRGKNPEESHKLVNGGNFPRNNQESTMPPPSTFFHTDTAEASTTSVVNNTNGSPPYRKLNPGKRFDRHTKPPSPPPTINLPPPMSSSDDESAHEAGFFTSQRISTSKESSPSSSANNQAWQDNHVASSIPHSRRTSPKLRFSASSPDAKALIIPSIKLSLPPNSPTSYTTSLGPLQPSKILPYTPKRAGFSPSPNRQIRNNEQQISKIPIPKPPPLPPPLFISRKHEAAKTYTGSPVSRQLRRPQSKSPSRKANPTAQKTMSVEEINSDSSLEKFDADNKDESRSRMKPLHWDKVRATSDRGTVWDQLKSSSFQLNEDAMASLFGCNSVNSVPREAIKPTKKFVLPSFQQENRILDAKKSQNIAILLRALNVTREEVSEALLDGNPEGLGPELFETLVKMAPTKEEEIKLKKCNDESSKLGAAERFLRAILDIPFAFKRVEAMLYRSNFDTEVKYLRTSFQTLEEASEELKNSRLFLKLLEAVLRTGNRMNNGTNRGDAKAFKLDTLLKLVDIKGTDGKTTLLHFVVQEIIRSEGASSDHTNESLLRKENLEEDFEKQGLQVVAGLSKELGNVKKAAGMDSDVLSSYVSKLETGLQKTRQVLQYENQSIEGKFFDSMKVFLEEAGDEISRVKAEERKALSLVKEVTQYFHGDTAKQEGHPLKIFMVIRDFLSLLDNVCKDVGRMQDRATMGSGRSFRISAMTPLPVLNRYGVHNDSSSDDDSM